MCDAHLRRLRPPPRKIQQRCHRENRHCTGRYHLSAITPGKSKPATIDIVETALGYQQRVGSIPADKYCSRCHDPESSPERAAQPLERRANAIPALRLRWLWMRRVEWSWRRTWPIPASRPETRLQRCSSKRFKRIAHCPWKSECEPEAQGLPHPTHEISRRVGSCCR
jgi:hypothetical protein